MNEKRNELKKISNVPMKNIAIGILSLICVQTNAAPKQKPQLIMSHRTVGGFMGPVLESQYLANLYSDGQVLCVSGSQKARVVATLASKVTTGILDAAQKLSPTQLVVENPDQSPCADAPLMTLTVVGKNGNLITVKEVQNCKVSKHPSGDSLIRVGDVLSQLCGI